MPLPAQFCPLPRYTLHSPAPFLSLLLKYLLWQAQPVMCMGRLQPFCWHPCDTKITAIRCFTALFSKQHWQNAWFTSINKFKSVHKRLGIIQLNKLKSPPQFNQYRLFYRQPFKCELYWENPRFKFTCAQFCMTITKFLFQCFLRWYLNILILYRNISGRILSSTPLGARVRKK